MGIMLCQGIAYIHMMLLENEKYARYFDEIGRVNSEIFLGYPSDMISKVSEVHFVKIWCFVPDLHDCSDMMHESTPLIVHFVWEI